MFLHLGGDVIVPKTEIIAIIDLDSATKSEITREFIQVAHEEDFISEITEKSKSKSLIITSKMLYYSPISSVTLKKRSEFFKEMTDNWDNTIL